MTDEHLAAFEATLPAMKRWAEAHQAVVTASTDAATALRNWADAADRDPDVPAVLDSDLPRRLRERADEVEETAAKQRNTYLLTAEFLAKLQELLDEQD